MKEAGTETSSRGGRTAHGNSAASDGCAPLEQRLAESLDVTLSAEELDQLKAELQGCTPCLAFIESLKATVKLCHDFGVEQAPAPLAADTKSRMMAAYERVVARRSNNSSQPRGLS